MNRCRPVPPVCSSLETTHNSRRQFLAAALPLLGGLRLAAASSEQEGESASRELIRDPTFSQGFILLEPSPGKRVVYGRLPGPAEGGRPVWDLAQWSSQHRLVNESVRLPDGSLRYANSAKEVIIGATGSNLTLVVNGSAEYGSRARKKGEPWVHLLVEQSSSRQPSIAELRELVLKIDVRLLRSELRRTDDYTPDLHAAQFQLFLTVQNRNSDSAGFGKFLWFGVPFYDDRYRDPPGHVAQDTAGSDMFIYTPPAAEFFKGSAHDKGWIRVDKDLVPLIKQALQATWQQGHLTESRELADYRITTVNLGWEVPGILDVGMQMRNLSFLAQT